MSTSICREKKKKQTKEKSFKVLFPSKLDRWNYKTNEEHAALDKEQRIIQPR